MPTNTRKRKKMDQAEERIIADRQWRIYEDAMDRGHEAYCLKADELEGMYLGGGLQWSDEEKAALAESGRLPVEINEIMEHVNTVVGWAVKNRMDIALRPRDSMADEKTATSMQKLLKYITDRCKYHRLEMQMLFNGLIQRRGYIDIRMAYDSNLNGNVEMRVLDSKDVIPDHGSKSYDPDDWSGVTIRRWWTLDEIEASYGKKARKKVEASMDPEGDNDFGDGDGSASRNSSFSNDVDTTAISSTTEYLDDEDRVRRVLIIDRQVWETVPAMVVVHRDGSIKNAVSPTPSQLQAWRQSGALTMRVPRKRVHWRITTKYCVLFDDASPFEHFTPVPYFPIFRQGRTRGMVDNQVTPQKLLNKALSNAMHLMSQSANGGWLIEQNSLTNMTPEELKANGADPNLVLEYRKNAGKPEKVTPNDFPSGMSYLVDFASAKITRTSGQTGATTGEISPGQSGLAIQTAQYAGQASAAPFFEALGYTRELVAHRLIKLVQTFFTEERVFRITELDANGEPVTVDLPINQRDPMTGNVLNNLTIGEYDLIVSEQPAQATFQDTQFNQSMMMREKGIRIPDDVVVRNSMLSDKPSILERMAAQAAPTDPVAEAKAILLGVQASVARVEGFFSAAQTAQAIAAVPAIAPMADAIARSAGFQDQDAAPIMPAPPAGVEVAPPPANTNPATPQNPTRGMMAGSETGELA